MLVKDINIRTLVSGDKQARITFETLSPEDIERIAMLSDKMEVGVTINAEREKDK
jgi:hypothetical protein